MLIINAPFFQTYEIIRDKHASVCHQPCTDGGESSSDFVPLLFFKIKGEAYDVTMPYVWLHAYLFTEFWLLPIGMDTVPSDDTSTSYFLISCNRE
jgi:hypothetical protein